MKVLKAVGNNNNNRI